VFHEPQHEENPGGRIDVKDMLKDIKVPEFVPVTHLVGIKNRNFDIVDEDAQKQSKANAGNSKPSKKLQILTFDEKIL
jgi:hypothetical protein